MSIVPHSQGLLITEQIPSPAWGTQLSYTFPATGRFSVNTFAFTVLTNATVADRDIAIHFQQYAIPFFSAHSRSTPLPASTRMTFICYAAATFYMDITKLYASWELAAPLLVSSPFVIKSSHTNWQATDRMTNIYINYSFWHEY